MPITKAIATTYAPTLWKCLNGELIVFKPAGVFIKQVKSSLAISVSRHKEYLYLNELEVRPTRQMVTIDPSPTNSNEYEVNVVENLSDHTLAVGERYFYKDIRITEASNLDKNTSGVLLLGINESTRSAFKLREAQTLRTFHVTGRLGMSTEDNFRNSLMKSKATYSHVYSSKLASLLASMQASHQKKMFEMCGVDLQSQTAYEIACKGVIRPVKKGVPVLYGIRCIELKKPEFVLEIHAINETEDYLCSLIEQIGLEMRTVAHCRAIRCIRHGPFDVRNSLLRGNYKIQDVLNNMQQCAEILRKHPEALRNDVPDVIFKEKT